MRGGAPTARLSDGRGLVTSMFHLVALFLFLGLTQASAQLLGSTFVQAPRALPPPEFDKPYGGELIVISGQTQERMKQLCPPAAFPWYLGCAYPTTVGKCLIVMAREEDINRAGFDIRTVMRHELGHCNGWPGNHPGAR